MKAGFVVLVGRSNVGKSTLLNALIGTKIAITSPKPQTTRRQIQGVLHLPEGQVVFVDTPGIFTRGGDHVTAKMNQAVKDAVQGVDLLLYVVDPTRAIGEEEERVLKMIKSSGLPTVLVINKIDDPAGRYMQDYRALAPEFAAKVEVSALKQSHLKSLVAEIMGRLPDGEAIYPPGQLTNMENKEWFAELIREKVFLSLHQEVPYGTTVEVHAVEDGMTKAGEPLLTVRGRILSDTDAHKKMLIGAGGRMIRKIGMSVRKELEQVTGKKVFLDLEVETDPHWPERMQ